MLWEKRRRMNKFLQMVVRAWDSDFTKVTVNERQQMKIVDKELEAGIYFTEEDVWN